MFTIEHTMKVVDNDQLEKELTRAEMIYNNAFEVSIKFVTKIEVVEEVPE